MNAIERIATLEANMATMTNRTDRHDRTLFGHGKEPGLEMRVDRLEQRRLSVKERIALYIAAAAALATLLQALWNR